jgi:hypothetical protein
MPEKEPLIKEVRERLQRDVCVERADVAARAATKTKNAPGRCKVTNAAAQTAHHARRQAWCRSTLGRAASRKRRTTPLARKAAQGWRSRVAHVLNATSCAHRS